MACVNFGYNWSIGHNYKMLFEYSKISALTEKHHPSFSPTLKNRQVIWECFVAVKIVFTIWPLAIFEKGIAVQFNIFASS